MLKLYSDFEIRYQYIRKYNLELILQLIIRQMWTKSICSFLFMLVTQKNKFIYFQNQCGYRGSIYCNLKTEHQTEKKNNTILQSCLSCKANDFNFRVFNIKCYWSNFIFHITFISSNKCVLSFSIADSLQLLIVFVLINTEMSPWRKIGILIYNFLIN